MGPKLRKLEFAEQRYDSLARPSATAVVQLWALLTTSVQTFRERGKQGEHGGTFYAFLKFIDHFNYIILAMFADCADEVLQLTRYFDVKDGDGTGVHGVVGDFVSRMFVLFITGHVVDTGFTRHMISRLTSQHMTFVLDGIAKTIGGATIQDSINLPHSFKQKSFC